MTGEEPLPEGLVSRIMRRLGLEQQLRIVRRHVGFFSGLTVAFGVLFFFAVIGFRQVMAESSFGPYLSLLISDPGIVMHNLHSFVLSIGESMPGLSLIFALGALVLALIVLRLAVAAGERFTHITESIHHGKR